MKKASIIDEILTAEDYNKLIEKAYQFKGASRTADYLDDLFGRLGQKNPLFWPRLSEAYDEYGNRSGLTDDDIGQIELLRGDRERFTSDKERDAFIYGFLAEKVNLLLEHKSFRNRKFTLHDLPLLDNKLKELRKLKGVRAKIYRDEINILTDCLLKLTFEGGFSSHDIDDIGRQNGKTVARILTRYYFSIKVPMNENDREEEVVMSITGQSGEDAAFVRLSPNVARNNSFEIFSKGYSFYAHTVGKAGFKKFQQFEIGRFKAILKCFSEIDDEYAEVSKYLYKVIRMTEKDMGRELKLTESFGINRLHHEKALSDLLTTLTEKVNFLYAEGIDKKSREAIIKNAVAVLTTNNYKREKRHIKFYCETTTVAYIMNAINQKFSMGGALNSYAIGQSGLFLVPTIKKPSEKLDKSSQFIFKPLKRDNVAQSASRFVLYRKDKARIEYSHYNRLKLVLETVLS